MKMLQPKKQMANMLLVACLLTSAIGVATVTGVATGETPEPVTNVTYETLAMEDGASVRVASKKEEAGIRFRLKMSKSEYEAITAQNSPYQNVSFGVLVAPEDYLTAGHELTEENVFGANAIYGWATRNDNGTWNEYTGNKVEIVNFETETMRPFGNEYRFDGSLVDIMDGDGESTNNVSREFRGVGYMRYTDNGTVKYAMVGDDDNVRSIAYVAQKAIEAGKITDATDVENITKFYITGVESKATVNYYKYGENGYEVADTVQSDNMQIGDIFNIFDAEKKSYDGYIFDNANSELSGKVYANGKTTLNVYYNPMDNLAPTVGSWSLIQNNVWKGTNSNWDYTPTVSELIFYNDKDAETDPDSYYIKNLTTADARYKWIGEDGTGTVQGKEVAQTYPRYASDNAGIVMLGANLSSLKKADLQALAEDGYGKLTFSFIATTHANGYRDAGYYTLDLDKVKADSTLKIRNDDGYINHDVFANYGMKANGHDNAYMTKWISVEYSLGDLIACYDQLFENEEYWTLAIPYGSTGYRNAEGEVVGNFYMSKLAFTKIADDLSNVLSSVDDWMLLQNGRWKGGDAVLSYTPTVSELTYNHSVNNENDHYEVGNLNTTTARYQLIGREETDITYKGRQVAQSYPMYANGNAHAIFMGGNLSHVSKADLNTLLSIGYTKLTFSFVHTTYSLGSRNSGYYLLDLAKVKESLDTESPLTLRNANGSINTNSFVSTNNTSNSYATSWVVVEYAIADLLACYDQLFAGESYWTLAIPYGTIGNNKNAEGEECGRCYVTKLAFTK